MCVYMGVYIFILCIEIVGYKNWNWFWITLWGKYSIGCKECIYKEK